MNNKGQALVEFVLILPIFLFIILAVVDFGMIFSAKTKLENDSSDIVSLFKSGTSIDDIISMYPGNTLTINDTDDGYYNIKIEDRVNIITPGLNRIFGDPYIISSERYVPHE